MRKWSIEKCLELAQLCETLTEFRTKHFNAYCAIKNNNWYGRDLIEVDRFYPSSKTCSCCGYKKSDLTLNDRTFKCPMCGVSIDRDYNAAINIKNEGLRLLNIKIGLSSPELTPLERIIVVDSLKKEKNVEYVVIK